MPGDEIIVDAGEQNTRAITIDRPIEEVWPWLAQLGQDRAGFYSYQRLENLVGCEMPAATTLLPAAAARPMRIRGPVTNAPQPSATARS